MPHFPRLVRRQPAQIMVLFALSLFAMVALLALVLDGGNVYLQRRTAQNAADAAALAGARSLEQATATTLASALADPITTLAGANAFGYTPTVTCAYFVAEDGVTPVSGGGIIHPASGYVPSTCPAASTGTIPPTSAGVHVDVRIAFRPLLMGMLQNVCGSYCGSPVADSHASANVGVLVGYDTRNAPFIACGGIGPGNHSLYYPSVTPAIATSTTNNKVLQNTPVSLPRFNPGPGDWADDALLVTPTPAATVGSGTPTPVQPAYVANPARDGRTYVLYSDNAVTNGTGADCSAAGFHGAGAAQQPTPYVQDVTQVTPIVYGDVGHSIPNVTSRVMTSSGCPAGATPPTREGDPGCVMILPITSGESSSSSPSGTRPLIIGAWGAFYVWCVNSNGTGCTDYAGQYISSISASGGDVINGWRLGQQGGIAVVHLSQ